MATYASATNPFIETNDNASQQPKSMKKNAPGMARPQKVISQSNDDTNRCGANNNNNKGVDLKSPGEVINLWPVNELDEYDGQLENSQHEELCGQAKDDDKEEKVRSCCATQSNDHLQSTHRDDNETKLSLSIGNNLDKSKAFSNDEQRTAAKLADDRQGTPANDDDDEEEIAKTCASLVEAAISKPSTSETLRVVSSLESATVGAKENCRISTGADCPSKSSEHFADEGLQESKDKSLKEQDSRQNQHIELIRKLRLQLCDLERYAYERGELGEQLPPSVLAERQNLIIETLRKKLSLNLDKEKIEKLELEQLKQEVDKEIDDLIDPLVTREHLLNQLKTQLTDLERYISHLHDTLGTRSAGFRSFSLSTESDCICSKHGPISPAKSDCSFPLGESSSSNSLISNDALPRTSRLIRNLLAQLVCSDVKIHDSNKKSDSRRSISASSNGTGQMNPLCTDPEAAAQTAAPVTATTQSNGRQHQAPITKTPQFHDGATWTLHLDKVILATDSLINLYSISQSCRAPARNQAANNDRSRGGGGSTSQIDEALVESVVRRQLLPALRDILSYGLIDPSTIPKSPAYASFLFDPYYFLSSLTCLPGLGTGSPDTKQQQNSTSTLVSSHGDGKIHLWDIFEDYYQSRSDLNNFKNSSLKTLSQSFQLTPSMDGPIKITSKQALLIAIDDVIQRLIKSRPNGPESHFKMLVYIALNQRKLATWLRIVFKSKSVIKKYYHNFSFVSQPEKMDRFLAIIDGLSGIEFKLSIDQDQSVADQFVSAF